MGDRGKRSAPARRNPGNRRRAKRMSVKVFLILSVTFLLAAVFVNMGRLIKPAALFVEEIAPLCQDIDEELPLILAVIQTESRFRQDALSTRGAVGLMQIMPDTGRWMADQLGLDDYDESKLFEREWNLIIGISYIHYLRGQFPGSLPLVLAAYNAGPSRVRSWLDAGDWDGSLTDLDDIPYPETRNYIKKALRAYEGYRKYYR